MPSRIEIELTSARADGSWTWRAAGARQPRGTVDASLLPAGAKAGDVLRAEAEFEIDGITITAVLPAREKRSDDTGRIDVIGRPAGPAVTTQLSSPGDRGAGRPGRPGGGRRSDGGMRTEGGGRPEGGGRTEGGGRPEAGRRPEAGGRPERGRRPEAGVNGSGGPGEPVAADAGDERSAGRSRRPPPAGRKAEDRPRGTRPSGERRHAPAGAAPEPEPRSRGRRLNPANTHRAAVLAALPPEQVPIAEQVLRGGIPAVRTAIHLEREKAAVEGRPGPNADALVVMAEELLPRLKAAEWRDRAEAAGRAGDGIALRDLRSVVAGADVARDDESRQLAANLRDRLERRIASLRDEWAAEVSHHLEEGRVVRALRLAARPPDAHSRFPAELAERLSEVAGHAMAADTPPDRWVAILEAVAASPVRRQVHPAALPVGAGPDVLRSAHQQAGRVPALAAMLGISIPPPPGPVRPGGRRLAPSGGSGHQPAPGD